MEALIELIGIFINDDRKLMFQFINQLSWVIGPAFIKWETDKLTNHWYTFQLEAYCGKAQ